MKIQSLSVVVPGTKCINNCAFCVARMKAEPYKFQLTRNVPFYDLYLKEYLKRLEYARDNGCNTVMLTGNCEPQQNREFLKDFGIFMMLMERPFRCIEMQTTGVLLDENYLRFLKNHVGVETISISLASFDDHVNAEYCGMQVPVDLLHLCELIKKYDFNLRLSINLTDDIEKFDIAKLFDMCQNKYGANQLTFRVLYTSPEGTTPQDRWIQKHKASDRFYLTLIEYILENSRKLQYLEFGGRKYSLHGMTVVVDDDCMAEVIKESSLNQIREEVSQLEKHKEDTDYKYLILRPDCKLYSLWDDPASLIF